jgi:hypothetical protein
MEPESVEQANDDDNEDGDSGETDAQGFSARDNGFIVQRLTASTLLD